jgi:transcriptional regulator GlxA family with amidase domain
MTKTVAILALPGVQLLDVSGPMDVFAQANVEAGRAFYRLEVLSCEPGPVRSSSGVRLLPDAQADEVTDRIDTLLVAGAPDAAEIGLRPALLTWIKQAARRSRRYGSVCTGAFVLASAGLLDGKRVATHWIAAKELAARYPKVLVDEDAMYVQDGKVRTAAGVTAGMDLALALVEEDLGRQLAKQVAQQLVMYFKRPGGQLQFSRKGEAGPSGRSVLQEVQRWVIAEPTLDHSVASLAEHSGLSPRHFARVFRTEVGVSPAAWVEGARVQAARVLLESDHGAPKQVAMRSGFANVDTLRRAFVRHVGVTPAEYRKRYGHGPQAMAGAATG